MKKPPQGGFFSPVLLSVQNAAGRAVAPTRLARLVDVVCDDFNDAGGRTRRLWFTGVIEYRHGRGGARSAHRDLELGRF